MIILVTKRLVLREFEETDAAFIHELVNSKGWLDFIGDRNVKNTTDARKYLEEKYIPAYNNNGPAMYLVSLRDLGTPVGMCGLIKRDHLELPDIGFAFLPQFYGKGYAFEAAEAITAFAADDLQLEALLAIVLPANVPSVKLLEKLGFKYQHMIQQDGDELMLYKKETSLDS